MDTMSTECAICYWNVPCYDDGEAYICIDRDLCHQNQRINELTHERNKLIEERDTLTNALRLVVERIEDNAEAYARDPKERGWRATFSYEETVRLRELTDPIYAKIMARYREHKALEIP